MTATYDIQTSSSLLQDLVLESGKIVIQGLNFSQFEQLAYTHSELRMEQEVNGNITIMAPIAGFGGQRENKLSIRLGNWALNNKSGETFSPTTGFKMPNGATKSPDAAWLSDESYKKLRATYSGKGFLPVVPDFIIEIRSESDNLSELKKKMTGTWIANGVKLAWMIDPYREKSYIYRADGTIETVEGFDKKLSGEKLLSGFELDLSELKLIDGK
ncbi:MAG: Uma2 family endonuclease [Paraglaciecola sp.]|jgi:Uma2 family endonuclease